MRLAFAVAAHLEPEILLVDEVLAVGDAAFQRKSLAKMSRSRAGGAHRRLRLPQPGDDPGALPAGDPARARQCRSPTRRSRRRSTSYLRLARALGQRRPAGPARTATAAAWKGSNVRRPGDIRRRQRRGRRRRRRPAGPGRDRGDRGAADDGVRADDPQQPRPPDHHARQRTVSAPTTSASRGGGPRIECEIDVVAAGPRPLPDRRRPQGAARRSRTGCRPPPTSMSSRG